MKAYKSSEVFQQKIYIYAFFASRLKVVLSKSYFGHNSPGRNRFSSKKTKYWIKQ